jgi:hypothetical protein
LLWNVVAINVVIFPEHFFAVHYSENTPQSASSTSIAIFSLTNQ